MKKWCVKPIAYSKQIEEFGIFLDQKQTGNVFVHYSPETAVASVEGSAYLTDEDSRKEFLEECSEELIPELLNRGIQDIESKTITIYQNQGVHQEELPEPRFDYGHPNSW